MLLVPGLAITNAIRDTVAGDLFIWTFLEEQKLFLTALAIAIGAGFYVEYIVVGAEI